MFSQFDSASQGVTPSPWSDQIIDIFDDIPRVKGKIM